MYFLVRLILRLSIKRKPSLFFYIHIWTWTFAQIVRRMTVLCAAMIAQTYWDQNTQCKIAESQQYHKNATNRCLSKFGASFVPLQHWQFLSYLLDFKSAPLRLLQLLLSPSALIIIPSLDSRLGAPNWDLTFFEDPKIYLAVQDPISIGFYFVGVTV